MALNKRDRGLVYSSETGRMCPGCDQAVDQCRCGAKTDQAHGDGVVRVGRATKGRKGKGVTVITGLAGDARELAALAKEMKTHCGAGGKVSEGVIEIQGDHRNRLVAWLQSRGHQVKKSGG